MLQRHSHLMGKKHLITAFTRKVKEEKNPERN